MISEAAEIAAPRNRQNTETSRHLQLPPRIGALLNLTRRVRREYARKGNGRIHKIHNGLANCLSKALARRKQESIDSFLENLDTDASWKSANIVMIPKPGRPISLLPSLEKIMERLILNRLLTYEDVSSVILEFQFGFRLQHGTPEQLHKVVNFA